MELETINRLYLELSQIATAKTARELDLEALLAQAELVVAWYGEKAASLVRYMNEGKLDAQVAVMKELELDGGKRAQQALADAEKDWVKRLTWRTFV